MSKFFLAALLLTPGLLSAQQNHDCVSPTQYVIQFLAKSGSVSSGSQDWVEGLENNKRVKTNYLFARGYSLEATSGASVSPNELWHILEKVPVDTVKGHFDILYESGNVVIKSEIVDTEVRKNMSAHERAKLEEDVRQFNEKSKKQSDKNTEFSYNCEMNFEEETGVARVTLKTYSMTRMSYIEFVQKIKKNKKGFS